MVGSLESRLEHTMTENQIRTGSYYGQLVVLTQEQVIQQLMQGGQPQQGRDIRTQPVPRESAIQGDAMKASEGSGVDSLRQTGDG